jgi:hypothetical protein
MSAPYMLFFAILDPSIQLEPEGKTVGSFGIRKIFHYWDVQWPHHLYAFILDDNDLEVRLTQLDSDAMTEQVIKPIIAPILPQDVKFEWTLVSLSELLEWPSQSINVADLVKELSGASGGGQG